MKNMEYVKELDSSKTWKYWEDADLYISDHGDFFRYRKRKKRFAKIGKTQQHGYVAVNCKINGVHKQIYGHRIIGKFFIFNPKDRPQINHKNGLKSDNRVSNLEWCTAKENNVHCINVLGKNYENVRKVMSRKFGEKNKNSKLSNSMVVEIKKMLENGDTNILIAKKFNMDRRTIGDIRSNITWKHITI